MKRFENLETDDYKHPTCNIQKFDVNIKIYK